MIDLKDFLFSANERLKGNYGEILYNIAINKYQTANHGDLANWCKILDGIKELNIAPFLDAANDTVYIGYPLEEASQQEQLDALIKKLIPWRKGPFNIAGTFIDTEWRSDWKWNRLKNYVNLKNKKVLDIGCGSGYHLWKMYHAGASFVIGIEPYLRFCMQFHAIKSLTPPENNVFLLPLTLEEIPNLPHSFDTIFSMGVLYHRKSPFEHLQQIRELLAKDGELILETLIVDGDENTAFTPENRYAKMHNIWFIPSVACCSKWLKKCGFSNIELIDVSVTTIEEQHSTPWMPLESLPDFLNPNDSTLTIENAPAPKRAIFKCSRG